MKLLPGIVLVKDEFIVLRAKLLAERKGDYTVYVFLNLDHRSYDETNLYIMCTKCPNWENNDDLKIGQEGFLKYKPVNAGIDTWYDHKTMQNSRYKYSANYFMEFIPITHVIDNDKIILKDQILIT